MSSETEGPTAAENGVTNILPIPPALEFPFPQNRSESSKAASEASAPLHHSSVPNNTSSTGTLQNGTTTRPHPQAADTPPKAAITPRPGRRKRFMTERPAPVQRASLLGLKRRQTGFVPTALNNAAKGYGGSDSSSSDDEEPLKLDPKSTHLSGRTMSGIERSESVPEVDPRCRDGDGQYRKFSVGNENYKTKGRVSKRDGRLNISVNETNNRGYLAHALGATLQRRLTTTDEEAGGAQLGQSFSPLHKEDSQRTPDAIGTPSALSQHQSLGSGTSYPPLNIVIMVIGSRGDIQPFLKVGKVLKNDYGHRVRIATHPAFKKFVEQDSGLEFFSVGGDPAELMAFMVKNPGLMPSVSTVRAGEIGRKRDSMYEMFQGFWRACINATDDEHDTSNLKMMGDKHPFVADAIIANPPCFAHVHCAERLGVPLHLMFTFPYSPTQQFPHPLANIKKSNVDANYTNFMSYPLVEMMTWQGLGDLVNRFRVKTLGLEPVSTLWAPGQLFRLKVPYTYMWSPGLIPKPADWGPEIDIAGFVFLDLASSFKPPETLAKFLEAGEPPVYIGFGSIVVDDPDKFTSLIFDAVRKVGCRALVSKGWGGLGDEGNIPENIYMLENTPHDWLFPRVGAVVHHGGAGTTAIGLKCGKPTMIVPFFGDQPFWGSIVAQVGAGAHKAIPYKRLDVDALAEGIRQCLSPEAKIATEKIAQDIVEEGDGAKNAAESFHRHLPTQGEHSMRCSVLPEHVAVWTLKHSNLRLSALAADLLVEKRRIKWTDLRLARHYEWNDFEGPGEPLTGGGAALISSAGGIVKGVGGMPVKWARRIKWRETHVKRRKRKQSTVPSKPGSMTAGSQEMNGKAQRGEQPEKSGELPHDGQHGAEKNLPEPHALPGRANADLQTAQENLPNGYASSAVLGDIKPAVDEDQSSVGPEASQENLAQELLEDAGASFAKTGGALAKVPMDLSLAIAQGFHNAPRLYGDSTVRTPPRISGIHSGLRAAGSEFAFGVYDGVTGLFLQPYQGAREHGALGFVQGVGKGIGGFVLKDLAAILGPFGYTMKGVHKELIKGRQPTAFIRKARTIQGGKDARAMDSMTREREYAKIEAAWRIVVEIRKEDEAHRQEGIKGRVAVLRDNKKMDKNGAFETVGHAKKALEAKQEDRREREDLAMARSSGEETKSGRKIKKKQSLLKVVMRKDGDEQSSSSKSSDVRPTKGADRQVNGAVLDLKRGKIPAVGSRSEGTTDGTIDVSA